MKFDDFVRIWAAVFLFMDFDVFLLQISDHITIKGGHDYAQEVKEMAVLLLSQEPAASDLAKRSEREVLAAFYEAIVGRQLHGNKKDLIFNNRYFFLQLDLSSLCC